MKFFWKKLKFNSSKEWAWERMKLEFLVDNYNILPKELHIGG